MAVAPSCSASSGGRRLHPHHESGRRMTEAGIRTRIGHAGHELLEAEHGAIPLGAGRDIANDQLDVREAVDHQARLPPLGPEAPFHRLLIGEARGEGVEGLLAAGGAAGGVRQAHRSVLT